MPVVLEYNEAQFPIRELVRSLFEVSTLELLHVERKDLMFDNLNSENESKTRYHETFYKRLNADGPFSWNEIMETYAGILREVVSPVISKEFIHQTFPSLRVHVPKHKATYKWHYDSDADHRHPEGEINFQIPLTVMYNTSATWCESVPGLGDFRPMNCYPGQILCFNGNKLTHGNKVNDTGLTRVSLDFRILPKENYYPEKNLTSVTKGTDFRIGGYYSELLR